MRFLKGILIVIFTLTIKKMKNQGVDRAYKVSVFSAIVGTILIIADQWLPTVTRTVDGAVQWDIYFIFRYLVANLSLTLLVLFVGSFLYLLASLLHKNLAKK